jgi:hypothetical protein
LTVVTGAVRVKLGRAFRLPHHVDAEK